MGVLIVCFKSLKSANYFLFKAKVYLSMFFSYQVLKILSITLLKILIIARTIKRDANNSEN